MLAAGVVPHSQNPAPGSRPQGSRCLQALFSCDCSSSCGWMPAPGKQAPEFLLPTGLDLPYLEQLLWLLVTCANKQAPELLLPKGLVSPGLQHYCTALLEPMPCKQAPKLPLPKGLVPLLLQQLLWLLVARTSKQASGLPCCP
jgi:hypothetical protein